MRFLADECCDFAAIRVLRAHGHDLLAVSEFQQRSADKDVMDLALAENRILLAEDKDFGWLVFAARMDSHGVVLIRFPSRARSLLADAIFEVGDRTCFSAGRALRSLRTRGRSNNFGPHHSQ